MITINSSCSEAQFFISVNGNRPKQYANNIVYLENNSEFSLELFNPKKIKILAKIKINGKYISTSGIVLKPGQRVFLERHLDEAKKFKFETYYVENSKQVNEAIENNGVVEVEFYDEYVITNNNYNLGYYDTTVPYHIYTTHNTCGNLINGTNTTQNLYNSVSGKNNTSRGIFEVSYSSSVEHVNTNMQETGRVEKGSSSNQTFNYDNSSYNLFYSNKDTWKILPLSQKPFEASELKKYCTSCRTKIKKSSWKFCPNCSCKID